MNEKSDVHKEISQLAEEVSIIKKIVKYQAENVNRIKTEQEKIKSLLRNLAVDGPEQFTIGEDAQKILSELEQPIEQQHAHEDDTLNASGAQEVNLEQHPGDDDYAESNSSIDEQKISAYEVHVQDDEAYGKDDLEYKIGGIWLNRIAMILIALGVAYFIKHAFDNNWIGPAGRIILGMVLGMAFIAWGEYLHETKYVSGAQGATGGGIAIMYFAVFAGYYFFREQEILPRSFAEFLSFAITVGAVLLSIRYNSKAISLLGLIGGFLAPLVFATATASYEALFTYLLILNLGILAISYIKEWDFLSYISFWFTEAIMVLSFLSYQHKIETMFIMTEIFFTLNFILYMVIPIVNSVVRRADVKDGNVALVIANTLIYSLVSFSAINSVIPEYKVAFALMMMLVFGALALMIKQLNSQDETLVSLFGFISIAFLTLAIPLQLHRPEFASLVTMLWAIEGVVLVWIGFNFNNSGMRRAGNWVFLFTVGRYILLDAWTMEADSYALLMNKWFLEALVVTMSLLIAGVQYIKNYDEAVQKEGYFGDTLLMTAVIIMGIGLSMENYRYYNLIEGARTNFMAMHLSLSIIWAVYSIIMVIIGIVRRYKPLRIFAIALFGLAIFKVFLFDLSTLRGVYRMISLVGLGLILLAVSFLYQKYRYIILDDLPLENEDAGLDEPKEV